MVISGQATEKYSILRWMTCELLQHKIHIILQQFILDYWQALKNLSYRVTLFKSTHNLYLDLVLSLEMPFHFLLSEVM